MLKKTREEKGLTLDEISKTLLIKKPVISAIESGDWEGLPPPVYVKGYVSQYAALLNVVDALEAEMARPESPPPAEAQRVQAKERHEGTPKGWTAKSKIATAVVVAVVAVAFIVFLNLPKRSTVAPPAQEVESAPQPVQTTPGTEAPQAVEQPKTNEQPVEASPPAARPSPAPIKASPPPARPSLPAAEQPEQAAKPFSEPKKLTIACQETTWMKIVIDGQEEKEFMLKPEEVVTIEAKDNFDLLIGNAGGVKLLLNGKDTGFSGEDGEVKHIRLP